MKKIGKYPATPPSNQIPCGPVKWLFVGILVASLLAPKDTVSLDCEFAIALFEDAAKECEAGVQHEGVKYQPCEYAELLRKNHQECTGEEPPDEEPQNEFGVVMVVDHMIEDDQLVAAASQKGFKQASLTALKSCMMLTGDARQCKELDRFGEICIAVAEAHFGTMNHFVTAEGDTRGDAEIEAISWCEEYTLESNLWTRHCLLNNSECSSDEILCYIAASGCSPYDVVASLGEFKHRAPQTLEEVSEMHEESAGKSKEPNPPETLEQMTKRLEEEKLKLKFEAAMLAYEINERFGYQIFEARTKKATERALHWLYWGLPRDEQGNVIFEE